MPVITQFLSPYGKWSKEFSFADYVFLGKINGDFVNHNEFPTTLLHL